MQYFKFKLNNENQEIIDNILSGLLPHENFEVEHAGSALKDLQETIPIEEVTGLNYIFFLMLERMNTLKMYYAGYANTFRFDVFDAALTSGLYDIIKSDQFEAKTFFDSYGKTFNLDVVKEVHEAVGFVYSEAVDMYNRLFGMAIATGECNVWISTLKQSIEHQLVATQISICAKILSEGYFYNGKMYRSPKDARDLGILMASDIKLRVSKNEDMVSRFQPTSIQTYEEALTYKSENRVQVRPLYYTGWEPLDIVFQIRSQDVVTIIADEGVGKTRLVVDQIYKAITQGNNVLVMAGETATVKIQCALEAIHIYRMYGLKFSFEELMDFQNLHAGSLEQEEELIIKINHATKDFYDNKKHGHISFIQSAHYETIGETIREEWSRNQTDIVFIDHILAMTSNGQITVDGRLQDERLRITYLYKLEDELVKSLNIAFFNTSHPSIEMTKAIARGDVQAKRGGASSASSSRYSTLIGVLHSTPELKKQDMVVMSLNKVRDFPISVDSIVLQRGGVVPVHDYDPAIQHMIMGAQSDDSLSLLFNDEEEDEDLLQ